MQSWNEITYYAGFDWARDHHMVVIVDNSGRIVENFEFEHSPEGWRNFANRTSAYPNLVVAIETSQGGAVDQLLQGHYKVYPINPRAARSYCERKAPSGTKTDHLDAWGLADALRLDGQNWKPLQPLDPVTQQLRLLCRDEVHLIEQRTALVNELQQALLEYYPVILKAFDVWTASYTWDFIIEFPTPEALAKAGKRRWEKFLHAHKIWRPETTEKRLNLFAQASELKGSEAVVQAKSLLAVSICKMLRILGQQMEMYRQQISDLFSRHPDHELFGSLPGAKQVLAPRLLAAIGSDATRYGTQEVLQCLAGTAPISFQSGQINKARMRWACDKFLRHTVHLWADCFRRATAWGQTYYQKKRSNGMSHACALRCLGQRLLKIVFRIILDKKPYDADLHAVNQQKHGSWVLTLNQPTQTR